jgi:hypothetical protein
MRNWKDDIPEIRRLAEQEKLTASQIAHELGVTKNAIIGVVRRNGIKLPGLTGNAKGRPPSKPIVEVFPVAAVDPMKYRDLRLLSLGGRNQCRNFLPGESGLDGLVCSAETPPGQPWCPTCRAMYYKPARSRHEPAQRINLHSQWSGAQVAWG